MFDEDAWNESEDVISEDEEIRDVDNLPQNERIAFKTYKSVKRQRRETRSKLGVMVNFVKNLGTYLSCKNI